MTNNSPRPDDHSTVPFEKVLSEELRLIGMRRKPDAQPASDPALSDLDKEAVYRKAQETSSLGLAFSGGGIRSATFNLGVLQALAEKKLLHKVDYLSTVSGGGYIGTWLHGVIRNRHEGNPEAAEDAIGGTLLTGIDSPPGPPDTDAIAFLRKYSNYLTPRVGLFSADTWVAVVIWIRNVLLNQLILIPAIAAIAAAAFLAVIGRQISYPDPADVGFHRWPVALGAIGLIVAVITMILNLRPIARQSTSSTRDKKGPREKKAESWIRALEKIAESWVHVALAGVTLASMALAFGEFEWFRLGVFLILGGAFLFLMIVVQVGGGFIGCFVARHKDTRPPGVIAATLGILHVLWMSATSALLATTLAWAIGRALYESSPTLIVTVGTPLMGLAMVGGVMLLVGLMGADYPDAAREWTAAIGARFAMIIGAWAVMFGLVIYGPWAVASIFKWAESAGAVAVLTWIATTLGGVLAGRSPKTDAGGGGTGSKRALELLVNVAPTVFLIGYVIAIAAGVHALIGLVAPPLSVAADAAFVDRYFDVLQLQGRDSLYAAGGLLAGSVFVCLIASSRINVNEFSLHHFYKNRLVRCYMGASKTDGHTPRKPNALTGFDPLDDFPIASLRPSPLIGKEPSYRGPYPIVNATLNLNAGSELAQQERKAASFVFTPAFCGFDPTTSRESREHANRAGMTPNGYRRTVERATDGTTSGYSQPSGPHIGTAMAISGAAANPNAGFHTSGPMAFLLTVFNARLGWWLGNPRWDAASKMPGPAFALKYLLWELLGQTTGLTQFVNLSDGGHFDNLGLYELVRRRCRFIIVCDSEEDHDLTFGSLGEAIRKCRADFGVEININPAPIRKDAAGISKAHCVVGRIIYPETETAFAAGMTAGCFNPNGRDKARGWLLYVKSSLTGNEPADVLEYHSRFGEFPHQSTADQFFSESQFESYRRLGLHVMRSTLEDVTFQPELLPPSAPANERCRVVRLFQNLTRKWYAPIPVSAEAASRLADAYVQTMRRLAEQSDAQPLLRELVTGKPSSVAVPSPVPAGLIAAGVDVMQLIENVYTEYGFEHALNRQNPRNHGWVHMFERWVKSPILYNTLWPIVREDYQPFFCTFIEQLRVSGLEEPQVL